MLLRPENEFSKSHYEPDRLVGFRGGLFFFFLTDMALFLKGGQTE
jgi:hypothetical protein